MRCRFPEKIEDFFADSKYRCIFAIPIGKANAEIAQLVERNLAKVEVAGPSPVFRSKITTTGKVVVFFVSGRGPGAKSQKQGSELQQKNDSHKGCHFAAERTIPSCVKTFKN